MTIRLENQMPKYYVALSAAVLLLFTLVNRTLADDQVIDAVSSKPPLRGEWELQPEQVDDFRETLHLGPQCTGEWRQSKPTLPVTIAWFRWRNDSTTLTLTFNRKTNYVEATEGPFASEAMKGTCC